MTTRREGRAGAVLAAAGGVADASGSAQSSSDAAFFAAYEWCLNPLASLGETLARMGGELDRRESLTLPWQREEAEINLFLLSAAACCAADDYLAHRPWDLTRLARRLPRLGAGIKLAEMALNLLPAVARAWHRPRIRRFRRELGRCADSISEILAEPAGETGERWARLRAAAEAAAALRLPAALLGWCARIPDAFRCQDLSHHDAVALARLFAQSRGRDFGPFIVVGVRTAGAYFAPLVKASLARAGLAARAWLTFRPKEGAAPAEVRRLRKLVAGGARVLLVDDTPNTGGTLVMMVALLRRCGTAPEDIVVLAPDHPAQLDWQRELAPVLALTLSSRERHKERLLG
ncbi:MAG: phosphoribosyltransferase, partial [Alphaproteobacteria bacterium]